MSRLFKDFKPTLARVASSTGFRLDDAGLMEYVQQAQERLLHEGNWPNVLEGIYINAYGYGLALPEEYSAITHIDVNGAAASINDPWYELLPDVPALEYNHLNAIIDQGESPVIRQPGGLFVKAFSDNDDQPITIYGDGTKETILPGNSLVEPGIWVEGADENPTVHRTKRKFTNITRVERPGPGMGFELVYENDDRDEFLGGRYSGIYAAPTLRQYKIPAASATENKTVAAVCRRKVTPIVSDDSPMVITNLSALRNMLMSIYYEEAENEGKAENYLIRAKEALKAENRHHHPQTPMIQVHVHDDGFGDID